MSKVPPIVGSRSSKQAVFFLDGNPHTLQQSDPRFNQAFDLIRDNKNSDNLQELLVELLQKDKISTLIEASDGKVDLREDGVYYENEKLNSLIAQKIEELWNDGLPYDGLLMFLDKLMRNPDSQCVERLYLYLESNGMPIINEGEYKGCFISYKSVREDYSSWHVGPGGEKVYSLPNTIVKMRRNLVDSEHNKGCSRGLHCGSMDYALHFNNTTGRRIILTIVDPENVVTVPYEDHQKLRCCEYYVIGDYNENEPLKENLYTSEGEAIQPATIQWMDSDWEDVACELSEEYENYDDYEEYEENEEEIVDTTWKPPVSGFKKPLKDSDNRYI